MRGRDERQISKETRQEHSRWSFSRARGGGSAQTETRSPEREPADRNTRTKDRRETVWFRQRSYPLRSSELEAMAEIGKFRMIKIQDLTEFHYQGDRSRAEQDLRNLTHQGLIRRVRIPLSSGNRVKLVVLTKQGKQLLTGRNQKSDLFREQKIYSGFVKQAEAFHDTAIYRMYQIEKQRIRAEGGTIRRIVLDYELKEKVFRPLAKAQQLKDADFKRKQEEIAQRHDLPVVEGKIAFPDLRIEYETRECERSKIDLEVTTEHYRPGQLLQKMQTGFKIYFTGSSEGHGSTLVEEREITGAILSL
ncbi:MAG: hypothetical protein ACE5J1_05995 [Nitrospiria bacterium]